MTDLTTHAGLGPPDLQSAWTALAAQDPHATVFQSVDYLSAWERVLGVDEDLTTVAVHDDGRLVGLVVEAIATVDGHQVARLAGGTEVTDYRSPIARPDAAKDLAAAWADRLAHLDVGRIDLSGLPDDTGWPDLLATALEAAGATDVARERHDVAPVVDLSHGFDVWKGSLDGKDRQELRRKTRKLARDLGPTEIVEVAADELEAGLDRFFAMNDAAAGDKAGFFDRPEMRAWFGELARVFHDDGTFRLHELTVAGNPVAATVSLVRGDHWGLYNSAFNPRLSGFSVGNVLVVGLVELAADEDRAVFDLLRGDEGYKYRFGAVDRDVVQVLATPAGARR